MTRFVRRLFLVAVISAAFATPALAQSSDKSRATTAKKAKKSKRSKKRAKKSKSKKSVAKNGSEKKAKNFDFEADKIDGDRINPDGTTIFGLPGNKKPSLIRVRAHFLPEILKAAEDV